jgi:hypothetical protein
MGIDAHEKIALHQSTDKSSFGYGSHLDWSAQRSGRLNADRSARSANGLPSPLASGT